MPVDDVPQGIFNTALNAGGRLWLAGCWIRAALLAGMWITLAWMPADALPRAAAQLLVATAALLLAFAHIIPGGLDVIARLPGTGPLARHMSDTSGRATVDVPGLSEGLGAFLAASLYVGWFPISEMPVDVRSAGLTLAISYTWEAVLQAVIDPGWYSFSHPAGKGMRIFRYAIPLIFAGILTFVLLPWTTVDAQVPLPLRIVLSASPLAYYLAWAAFDVMLKASATSLRNSRNLWRWETWGHAHGSVKNTLVFLKQYVEDPEPDLEEIRSLVRNALVVVNEFKGQLIGGHVQNATGGSVSELWDSVQQALGSRHVRCVLDGESAEVRLSVTDYQIAQRVLPDLVSNAIKAGASSVDARCSVGGQPEEVSVEIADNGAGMTTEDLSDPRTSLRMLRARLTERNGDLRHVPNETGGTTVTARWRASRGLGPAGLYGAPGY
ncbi:MAG TPA: ATP-binding protein [Streptosporangiaceae bacterium]|nr:ATP-binding protein [Streptosporangiaceae bacterium]